MTVRCCSVHFIYSIIFETLIHKRWLSSCTMSFCMPFFCSSNPISMLTPDSESTQISRGSSAKKGKYGWQFTHSQKNWAHSEGKEQDRKLIFTKNLTKNASTLSDSAYSGNCDEKGNKWAWLLPPLPTKCSKPNPLRVRNRFFCRPSKTGKPREIFLGKSEEL